MAGGAAHTYGIASTRCIAVPTSRLALPEDVHHLLPVNLLVRIARLPSSVGDVTRLSLREIGWLKKPGQDAGGLDPLSCATATRVKSRETR